MNKIKEENNIKNIIKNLEEINNIFQKDMLDMKDKIIKNKDNIEEILFKNHLILQ